MEQRAPAKINLALHVTGQRDDGYHLLDSLVVFARDIGDTLSMEPAGELSLSVSGPLAEGVPVGPENLILRAAALYGPSRGARITLDKHLPHAAGIGGGSADAAATLRGLSQLWGLDLPPVVDCLRLGADVPVCLSTAPQRMRGIGEDLSPVPPLPALFAVLINPRVEVPTGPVFGALDRKDNAPMDTPAWSDTASFLAWLSRQRNDLEQPARVLVPAVDEVIDTLTSVGAALARMSGSGATCFGLFGTRAAAHDAAEVIAAQHPDWWVAKTTLLDG